MKLNIYRHNELVNTFDDCLDSLLSNLWNCATKSSAVRKVKFATYGNESKAIFTLNDGSTEGVIYEYIEIPSSWGMIDTYKILHNK